MRFKTSVRNINTFTSTCAKLVLMIVYLLTAELSELTQSLCSIGKLAWLRLSEDEVRFVIHAPEGTQVWAYVSLFTSISCAESRLIASRNSNLTIPTLFEDYRITSANNNIINLEVPLQQLHRALRSCASASDAVLRLTKRASDGVPILCLTITTASTSNFLAGSTLVTQEVPVRVLSAASVDTIQEPQTPEADVHIYLPPLSQLRSITERFNKLSTFSQTSEPPQRLILSANMSGEFKMALKGSEVSVESKWRDLQNPVLAEAVENREEHPSTIRDQTLFATVRVDGREWAKVLKVGNVARRVVACFCEGLAIVLYVFLTEESDPDQTVLTYYMSSYSAE
jgi:HUS1 checkpoint protein